MKEGEKMATNLYPRPWMTEIRKHKGWTTSELADIVGTTHNYICAIERGTRSPRPPLANRLASALGIDVGFFMPHDVQNGHDENVTA